MTISHKQKILNDMIKSIMQYVEQNQNDVEMVMIVALRGENGDLKNHIQYRCEDEQMPHYFGHAVNDMRSHGMGELFDDIMAGMACAMIQEGGAITLEELLTEASKTETVH